MIERFRSGLRNNPCSPKLLDLNHCQRLRIYYLCTLTLAALILLPFYLDFRLSKRKSDHRHLETERYVFLFCFTTSVPVVYEGITDYLFRWYHKSKGFSRNLVDCCMGNRFIVYSPYICLIALDADRYNSSSDSFLLAMMLLAQTIAAVGFGGKMQVFDEASWGMSSSAAFFVWFACAQFFAVIASITDLENNNWRSITFQESSLVSLCCLVAALVVVLRSSLSMFREARKMESLDDLISSNWYASVALAGSMAMLLSLKIVTVVWALVAGESVYGSGIVVQGFALAIFNLIAASSGRGLRRSISLYQV